MYIAQDLMHVLYGYQRCTSSGSEMPMLVAITRSHRQGATRRHRVNAAPIAGLSSKSLAASIVGDTGIASATGGFCTGP